MIGRFHVSVPSASMSNEHSSLLQMKVYMSAAKAVDTCKGLLHNLRPVPKS